MNIASESARERERERERERVMNIAEAGPKPRSLKSQTPLTLLSQDSHAASKNLEAAGYRSFCFVTSQGISNFEPSFNSTFSARRWHLHLGLGLTKS